VSYYEKPFKDHRYSPPMSVYLTGDDAPEMEPMSCIWCKRTITDVKGNIETMIATPMPLLEFGIALNVKCKLCHQDYRFLIKSEMYQG